jgi:predicted Fe-S protein YdhL (DUF1289 family)
MRALGFAHDDAAAIARGERCVSCDEPFVRGHGMVTACAFCWPKLSPEEKATVLKAVHEEATKDFFRRRARAARKNDE